MGVIPKSSPHLKLYLRIICKLPQHDAITFNDVYFDLNNVAPQTRINSGKEYQIIATKGDIRIITYLFIDKIDDGYLFEHYTEDRQLIASIQCDHNLMIEAIYIEELPETRGFRFWWACTQIEYYKMKKYQETEGGMMMDIAKDWLPMSTINSVAAGLYCMGIK